MNEQEESTAMEENVSSGGQNTPPVASSVTQEVHERSKADILTASPAEARELEQFIDSGHRSPHTLLLLSVIGVILLFCGLLYWDKMDIYPEKGGWRQFGRESLPIMVENQAKREWRAYRLQPGVETPPDSPQWPVELYFKLRMDIYIIAGLVLLLCWVLMRIERAKSRRNDLLAFRALAREIEKLRLRVRELEEKKANQK